MNRVLRKVKFDPSKTGIMLRTTERPKYLDRSLPSVLDSKSDESKLLVLNNCRDDEIRAENLSIVEDVLGEDPREQGVRNFHYREYSELLGVPGSVNQGVRLIKRTWPEVDRVFVCDDDCLAPDPKEIDGERFCWDEVLSVMLNAGWKIAGHPNRVSWYNIATVRKIGGIWGYMYPHVSGSYSGFKIEDWEKVGGVPSSNKLFGFGPFCNMFTGSVGYWADPKYLVEDMDRHTNPKSLRTTEYFQWYRYMRPDKAKELDVDKEWKE